MDVVEDSISGKIQRAGGEVDLQGAIAQVKRMRRGNIDIRPGGTVRAILRNAGRPANRTSRKGKHNRETMDSFDGSV